MNKGKVYIVGAGPGDIGLFTLKGIKYLQKADVVVYDFHLNAQILNYINHNAEFIYAGKRGGKHEMSQSEINEALVKKALEGKTVVRLKGGDPFVFGRGAEEAEALVQADIPFEIIPGVSSSVAVPAYAGIPVTHRNYSSSFAVITGNEDITKAQSTIDWSHFAKGFDTLVFLMGIKNISSITQKLIEYGKSPDTPTAVIRWGCRPDQNTIIGTLSEIPSLITEAGIKPPAVMVVGNVVKLRETLMWYEQKPLFGHRILITRQYTEEYAPLEELGAEVFEFATIKITPCDDYTDLDRAISQISQYQWLVFTSVNGFRFFFERLIHNATDIRDLKGIKICVVGQKTAKFLQSYGLKPHLVPEEFNAETLAKAIINDKDFCPNTKILLPVADNARDIFAKVMHEAGASVDMPQAYKSVIPTRHGKRLERFLRQGRITVATFTSAATFHNFIEIVGEDAIALLKSVTISAIGPVTAKAINKAGLQVHIMPQRATIEDMVNAIIEYLTKNDTK